MRKLFIAAAFLVALIASGRAAAQTVELTCPQGYSRLPFIGRTYNVSTDAFRDWLCADPNGNISHSGTETFANVDAIQFVDGVTNTTVQQAISKLPASGGTVYIPPGTYVGPPAASYTSGVRLVSLGNVNPPIIWSLFNGAPYNSFSSGTGSQNLVKFTYTSSLTISDVSQIGIEGIVFDFGGTGGLTLKGVSHSEFTMAVINAAITAPAVVMTPDTANNWNMWNNRSRWFIIHGGNEGLKYGAVSSNPLGATENIFDLLQIYTSTQPAGTYNAVDFVGWCDSSTFHKINWFYTTAVTTANGIVFNSTSASAENDADAIQIGWYDETGSNTRTGSSIIINPSFDNMFTTGVLQKPISVTSWSGISTYVWNKMTSGGLPDLNNPSLVTPVVYLNGPNPAVIWQKGGALSGDWSRQEGASQELNLFDLNSADADKHREQILSQGNSNYSAKSTGAIQFNMIANSGTGGVNFGSGGASPTVKASVDSSGRFNGAAVPGIFSAAGTQQTNAHIVKDTCTLGTNCNITLAGAAAFTSNTSYDCWARDATTPANAVTVTRTSGSALAFTGTGTDVINYECVGN